MSITIALSKGRLLEDSLPLLAKAGITPKESLKGNRRLVLETHINGVNLLIIRATDVPTYVERGAADIGIAGKDVLLEHGGPGLYEPLDLDIAKCKLMVAAQKGADLSAKRLRVATKFTKTAKKYFASRHVQAEVIKLYGSMELAPLVGLADCIVDLVDTGNTLKANGLEPLEHIMDISARLVVNKASLKLKHKTLLPLIDAIAGAVKDS